MGGCGIGAGVGLAAAGLLASLMAAAPASPMAGVTRVVATSVATEISLGMTLIALVALVVGRISGSLVFILPVPAVAPLAAVPPAKGGRSVLKSRIICRGILRLMFEGRTELLFLARGSHIPLPLPFDI